MTTQNIDDINNELAGFNQDNFDPASLIVDDILEEENNNEQDPLDNMEDIDYKNLSIKDKIWVKKKKKNNQFLETLLKKPKIEVEKHIIFLFINNFEPNELMSIISEYDLKKEYFITEIWQKIFEIILSLAGEWKADFLLLKKEFDLKYNKPNDIKLFKDFFKLGWFSPKKELIRDYILVLLDNYNSNQLENLSLNLTKAIEVKDKEKIEFLKYEIANFSTDFWEDKNEDIGLVDNDKLAEGLIEWIEWGYKESKTMVPTWLKEFDETIGWFEKWTMNVFLARPSVWKSVALINCMYWAVKAWYNCLYVSAEMYAKYIMSRWTSIELEISNSKIRKPSKLSKSEIAKIKKFANSFKNEKNAHFFYEGQITARDIEMKAKEIKTKTGRPLDAIYIDYIWKMFPNSLDMSKSRNDIVTDISRETFSLWWKLNVAIVTATQLNRASAKNAEQESLVPPTQSDIRDSWAIAQDADLLIWITRDFEQWKECRLEDQYTDFNFHWIKNRNGEVRDFTFKFHPVIQKLKNNWFLDETTVEWLQQKQEIIKQDNIVKEILKEDDVFSKNKDLFS